jgi:parvulin-like peptidyl-prolyl isomerase
VKSKFFTRSSGFAFAILLVSFGYTNVHAQEGEPTVVDEVIAQVNNDVIMLSMLKREMKEAADALSKQDGKPVDQATAEVTKRQPEIIATLVNEQLLLQKGKELDLSNDVEAEVNRRMLEVAKEQNIKTIAELDEAMRRSKLDPVSIRSTMRVELMKNAVMQREVDGKLFYALTDAELHQYFDAHPGKFTKPEVVVLSEIFLSLAGKNPADVQARAAQLIKMAKEGSDFGELAAANSERSEGGARVAVKTKGLVGTFEVPNLRQDIANAIKNVKGGDVSEPVVTDEGIQIIHVDQRTPGSTASTFNENAIREALMMERAPKERETYLQNLRNDAYIKIADDYSGGVLPLLKIEAPKTASVTDTTAAGAAKEKKKKSLFHPF